MILGHHFRAVQMGLRFGLFDLGEGTLLGRQGMHGLPAVTGDATVAGYDENPYLPVVHQLLRGRRQTLFRGKMQFHALPQAATGHQILFRQIPHVVSICYRRIPLFPPKRDTIIAFSQSPRNVLRGNPVATPFGYPARTLEQLHFNIA